MLQPAAQRFPSPPDRHPRLSAPLHACSESRCAGPPIVVLRAQCPLVLIGPTCKTTPVSSARCVGRVSMYRGPVTETSCARPRITQARRQSFCTCMGAAGCPLGALTIGFVKNDAGGGPAATGAPERSSTY